MTVAENIILGLDEPGGFCSNMAEVERTSRRCPSATAWRSTRDAYIWQLSVGEQQRVEILKALYHGARHPRSSTSRPPC